MKNFNLLITKYWHYLFTLLSIVYIASTLADNYSLDWLVKILPLSLLIIYFCLHSQKPFRNKDKVLFLALTFSLLGDFILDFSPGSGFVFGLAAFLIAHIFYIIRLGRWKYSSASMVIALPLIGYGSLVCYFIYPNLDSLKTPVLTYMSILLIMCFAALFSKQKNYWIQLGGISFVISDSVLGINKFYQAFQFSSLIVMSTYYFAQFCLFKGLLAQQNSN